MGREGMGLQILPVVWAMGAMAILTLASCERGSGGAPASQAPEPAEDAQLTDDGVKLDVWLERLEVGSRELYSAREAVVEAVGIKPGDHIADVGSGTGLYSLLFAEAVGEDGVVFSEDIEALFLDLINRRADDLGINNITAVLGRENSVSLPKQSVDIVFIADTYHYFSEREAIMKTIFDALRAGGKLVIVDYDIVAGEARPDGKEHVRFGKTTVISEIEFFGFEFQQEHSVEGLDDNYFLRFSKP